MVECLITNRDSFYIFDNFIVMRMSKTDKIKYDDDFNYHFIRSFYNHNKNDRSDERRFNKERCGDEDFLIVFSNEFLNLVSFNSFTKKLSRVDNFLYRLNNEYGINEFFDDIKNKNNLNFKYWRFLIDFKDFKDGDYVDVFCKKTSVIVIDNENYYLLYSKPNYSNNIKRFYFKNFSKGDVSKSSLIFIRIIHNFVKSVVEDQLFVFNEMQRCLNAKKC